MHIYLVEITAALLTYCATMEELGERIRACVMVELLAADIYEKMAEIFPEKRAFFMQLHMEEKNHAALLTAGKGLLRKEDSPDFVAPNSLSEIREAIDFAMSIRRWLDSEDLPLEEALELLIEFENTAAESNYHKVFDDKSEWEIIQKLGRLRVESGDHADRIRLLLQKDSSSPE